MNICCYNYDSAKIGLINANLYLKGTVEYLHLIYQSLRLKWNRAYSAKEFLKRDSWCKFTRAYSDKQENKLF